jgi:hypothetical protein
LAWRFADIGASQHGRAELRGTTWQARNVAEAVVVAGQRVRVVAVDGLTLDIRPNEVSVDAQGTLIVLVFVGLLVLFILTRRRSWFRNRVRMWWSGSAVPRHAGRRLSTCCAVRRRDPLPHSLKEQAFDIPPRSASRATTCRSAWTASST